MKAMNGEDEVRVVVSSQEGRSKIEEVIRAILRQLRYSGNTIERRKGITKIMAIEG